jgi:hypothetical protein
MGKTQNRKEISMQRLSIRVYLGALSANVVHVLLWVLGVSLGGAGYEQTYPIIFKDPPDLISILAVVIQFLASIYFIILTLRKAFPSGIIESIESSQRLPFIKRAQEFPVSFMLGVFTGLVGDALVIFIGIIRLSS